MLKSKPEVFASSWNFVDAFLKVQETPEVYRFLRQVMMARRALLLIEYPH